MSLRRLRLAVLAAACIPAGCATSPPTRFFTLDPTPPSATRVAGFVAPVRVDAVHLPPQMDRPELVRETAPDTVTVDDFARWSAPIGETARRTLTLDLIGRLPSGTVVPPDSPKPVGARGLVVDVLAFGADGGRSVMEVGWTVTPAAPASAPTAAPLVHRLSIPSSGTSSPATAADLSTLMGQLADQIAAELNAGGR